MLIYKRAFSSESSFPTHLCQFILILLWARLYFKRNILWVLILWDSLKFAQVIFQTKQPKVLFWKGEWCSLREQGKCPLLTLTLVVLVVLLGRHIFELFCVHIVIIDLHVSLSTCSVCVFDTWLFTLMWSRLREACVWNPVVFLCKNPKFASEDDPQFASEENPQFENEENP